MRSRCVLLLTLLAAVSSAVLATGVSASTTPPGADYRWAQPETSVGVPHGQPPAWVPISAPASTVLPGFGYRWAQPGTSLVNVTHGPPPAGIPISVSGPTPSG